MQTCLPVYCVRVLLIVFGLKSGIPSKWEHLGSVGRAASGKRLGFIRLGRLDELKLELTPSS